MCCLELVSIKKLEQHEGQRYGTAFKFDVMVKEAIWETEEENVSHCTSTFMSDGSSPTIFCETTSSLVSLANVLRATQGLPTSPIVHLALFNCPTILPYDFAFKRGYHTKFTATVFDMTLQLPSTTLCSSR
ncbi:unnamed protein product [Taenia asiatica]|uniref:ZP domain-containing protein n=1 Tax=Taenia asiatica TaxID=60517 RepID=A0A0R3WG16_TAEAS|nr:unnamed protein product [Taenia asiatica]